MAHFYSSHCSSPFPPIPHPPQLPHNSSRLTVHSTHLCHHLFSQVCTSLEARQSQCHWLYVASTQSSLSSSNIRVVSHTGELVQGNLHLYFLLGFSTSWYVLRLKIFRALPPTDSRKGQNKATKFCLPPTLAFSASTCVKGRVELLRRNPELMRSWSTEDQICNESQPGSDMVHFGCLSTMFTFSIFLPHLPLCPWRTQENSSSLCFFKN